MRERRTATESRKREGTESFKTPTAMAREVWGRETESERHPGRTTREKGGGVGVGVRVGTEGERGGRRNA